MMNIQDEIIKAIELLIDKKLEQHSSTVMKVAIVLDLKNEIKVQIDGKAFSVTNGTNMTFTVGSFVWVCIPNGDYNRAFIIAKKQ